MDITIRKVETRTWSTELTGDQVEEILESHFRRQADLPPAVTVLISLDIPGGFLRGVTLSASVEKNNDVPESAEVR